jgi:hypothetical protein
MEQIENIELDDVFLLLLPDFSMQTSFHYLIQNENYTLFQKIANSIQPIFKDFIDNTSSIDKIIDMLIYIFENISTFSFNSLEEIYCNLNFFIYDQLLDEDEDEDELDFQMIETVKMVQNFLTEIRKKIETTKLYLDFSCEFDI